MDPSTLQEFARTLRAEGFRHKALFSDDEMAAAGQLFEAERGLVETPVSELRYMEGLCSLRLGYLIFFRALPREDTAPPCRYGRRPTALDI